MTIDGGTYAVRIKCTSVVTVVAPLSLTNAPITDITFTPVTSRLPKTSVRGASDSKSNFGNEWGTFSASMGTCRSSLCIPSIAVVCQLWILVAHVRGRSTFRCDVCFENNLVSSRMVKYYTSRGARICSALNSTHHHRFFARELNPWFLYVMVIIIITLTSNC